MGVIQIWIWVYSWVQIIAIVYNVGSHFQLSWYTTYKNLSQQTCLQSPSMTIIATLIKSIGQSWPENKNISCNRAVLIKREDKADNRRCSHYRRAYRSLILDKIAKANLLERRATRCMTKQPSCYSGCVVLLGAQRWYD
jgi:hypothetical protein